MSKPFSEFNYTPLWAAVASILAELEAAGEVKVETRSDYVIGLICRELAAKHVVKDSALETARGR